MLAVPRRPMTSQLPSLISTSALGTRKARYRPSPAAPVFAAISTQWDRELPDPKDPVHDTRKPPTSAVAIALGSKAVQQDTGPWPNTSSLPSGGRPRKAAWFTALQTEVHHPAEPSARAIASTAPKRSSRLPPSPPLRHGIRIDNSFESSRDVATLSARRPRRSPVGACALIRS